MRAIGGAALVALLLLPVLQLAHAQSCFDPGLVLFGTGQQTVEAKKSPDGRYRVNPDNTFDLVGTCVMTGDGASRDANRWRAQLILCGTSPCQDSNLPSLAAATPTCSRTTQPKPACALAATGRANLTLAGRDTPQQYSVGFRSVIPNAWRGRTTYYYIKCFYLCRGSIAAAQERSAASFTLEGPAPLPPSPPPAKAVPTPPAPPAEPAFYGAATAVISSTLKDPVSGAIYPPPSNLVPVVATCIVAGQYALVSTNNWPAQLLVCGNPAGSGACASTDYDAKLAVMDAEDVQYNGTVYVATYKFNLVGALFPGQVITYRYFTCLYRDAGGISKRAGASVDVVSSLFSFLLRSLFVCSMMTITQ